MIRLNLSGDDSLAAISPLAGGRFHLLLRLQRFALPYWDKVLLSVVCSLAMVLLAVVPAMLARRLIDVTVPSGNARELMILSGVMVAAHLVIGTLALIGGGARMDGQPNPGSVMTAYTTAHIALDLKRRFYAHLQRQSVRFYVRRPVGEHIFRCMQDPDDAAFIAAQTIPKLMATVFRIVVLFAVLQLLVAPWVNLAVVAYVMVFFGMKQVLTSRVRKYDRITRQELQSLDAVVREILVAFRLVRAYARERTARRWYYAQASRTVRAGLQRGVFWVWDMFLNWFFLPAYLAVLQLFIGASILAGTLSLGDLTAIGLLASQFLPPFQDAVTLVQLVRQRLVPAERMEETLSIEPEIVDPKVADPVRTQAGPIALENVWFSYDGRRDALRGVSLVVHPGEKIAIVGPTGAGKTTLCNILMRMIDPDRGEVRFGGVPYPAMRQAELRRHLAFAMQGQGTFARSIRENILYGRPGGDDAVMRQAAELAEVHEFVEALREGYETRLSEAGSLSGGQKQRVSLARALAREAPVLILDEATSALDPVTEARVLSNLAASCRGRTVIFVAHNVVTARVADRIVVIDDGRVVEQGTHASLMARGGRYAALWPERAPGAGQPATG